MPSSLARVQRERDGRPVLSKETVELPAASPHDALVRVEYVAQNPTDGLYCEVYEEVDQC